MDISSQKSRRSCHSLPALRSFSAGGSSVASSSGGGSKILHLSAELKIRRSSSERSRPALRSLRSFKACPSKLVRARRAHLSVGSLPFGARKCEGGGLLERRRPALRSRRSFEARESVGGHRPRTSEALQRDVKRI